MRWPFFGVAVEEDAELAGVVVVEVAADVVAGLALGERRDHAQRIDVRLRLDAHDGGAVVGEEAAADGAGAEPGEVGDFDAFEGETAILLCHEIFSRKRERIALNSSGFSRWLKCPVSIETPPCLGNAP